MVDKNTWLRVVPTSRGPARVCCQTCQLWHCQDIINKEVVLSGHAFADTRRASPALQVTWQDVRPARGDEPQLAVAST